MKVFEVPAPTFPPLNALKLLIGHGKISFEAINKPYFFFVAPYRAGYIITPAHEPVCGLNLHLLNSITSQLHPETHKDSISRQIKLNCLAVLT